MRDVIIFALLGAGTAVLAYVTAKGSRRKYEMKAASGVIDRVMHYQGVIYYYVSFAAEGKVMTGEAGPYSSDKKWLHEGDNVSINYYFTKARQPQVEILNNELEPCSKSFAFLSKIFCGISAAFFLVAIIMLIQSLL